ncbi:MAG: hypothetical protein ACKVOW_00215 [Chitinophagaceae bacterium]
MKIFDDTFQTEKYKSIPFSFNKVRHPILSLTIKNESALFLLDKGAASDLLDVEFARKLSFPLTPTGQKGGGAGGPIHDVYLRGPLELFYNDIKFSF